MYMNPSQHDSMGVLVGTKKRAHQKLQCTASWMRLSVPPTHKVLPWQKLQQRSHTWYARTAHLQYRFR